MNGLIHGYVGLYTYNVLPPINGVTYGPLLLTGTFIALESAFGFVEGACASLAKAACRVSRRRRKSLGGKH